MLETIRKPVCWVSQYDNYPEATSYVLSDKFTSNRANREPSDKRYDDPLYQLDAFNIMMVSLTRSANNQAEGPERRRCMVRHKNSL